MYTARFDDPIAHTSAVAGLIGGATAGLVAGALVGAALVATVATGGVAAPLLIGAMLAGGALTGGALGAWVGEYIGSLSIFSSITGKITTGSPNVFVNGKPLARVKFDIGECTKASPCIPLVATGSGTVFINRLPAARVDDKLTCGGFIKEGSWNVRIGGGTVAYLPVESEVHGWAHKVVIGAGIVGALLLGGWAVIPGLVGAFAVGYVGGEALGWVGRRYGDWLSENIGGLPSDWEKTGTFTGQALGGWLGAKGGPRAWELARRIEVDPNALGANGGNIRLRPDSPEGTPPTNEHLRDLPIHPRYDRFYIKAGELTNEANVKRYHPLNDGQMYGSEEVGHRGVVNLTNEELMRFGGPQGNDPIGGYRDWQPGDDLALPGSRIYIQSGHHRTAEIANRVVTGQISPDILIEAQIESPRNPGYH